MVIRAIVTAFSCFSAIPVPHLPWDERNMRYMMAAFPLIGAVIGVTSWLWWLLAAHLGFGSVLTAAGLTLLPLLVTGGIHMDGFADVIDALSSHASPERKREILRDPRVGAFAIMGISGYLIAYLGLASEMRSQDLLPFACIPLISRCLSGYATVSFRTSSNKGMLAAEHSQAHRSVVRTVLLSLLSLTGIVAVVHDWMVGTAMLASAILTLICVRRCANREFGGMSGDLAGFFLQLAELVMLACLVIVGRLVS